MSGEIKKSQPWPPPWVNRHPGLARRLDGLVFQMGNVKRAHARERAPDPNLARRAKSIERGAKALLRDLRKLEESRPLACHAAAQRVLQLSELQLSIMTEDEARAFRAGFVLPLLTETLTALGAHARAIEYAHRTRVGRPKNEDSAWAVGVLALVLQAHGVELLPIIDYDAIEELAKQLFRKAGWGGEPTGLTLEAFRKARRAVAKGRW